jgi:hypothetical protein
MTESNTSDTLRQVRSAEVQTMSRDEKTQYLRAKGWRRVQGNRWQSGNGIAASFGAAVTTQLLADLDGSP